MFTTKLEVDRHVESCLKRISTEQERNLRCYAFAKLYFKVGDFEQAHRYVCSYLNSKPNSAEGQSLLGKTLEKLDKKEAALEAYKTSLESDPKQNNLVLKICELLASDDVSLDQSGARYFCNKAQSLDPQNPILVHLKERLIQLEGKDPNDITQLLLKELETRPTDINIRVRLLKHLLENKQIKEAYTHVYDIEQRNLSIFMNNLNWYETVVEVLMLYGQEFGNGGMPWQYGVTLISAMDKLVALSLDERNITVKNNTEYVNALFKFDQSFEIVAERVKTCQDKQFVQEFMKHYTGQLCFHFITLLFKNARKDLMKYKEAAQVSLPLLFAAYNFQPVDLHSMWIEHAAEAIRLQAQRWHKEASFRCSQTGHILTSAAKDRKSTVIEKATQGSIGLWREHTFKKIFVLRDQQAKIKTSYFVQCSNLVEIQIRLPDHLDLIKYDEVSQLVHPDNLHHYIWIGLNQKLSALKCSAFQGLSYSIKNLNNCGAETLNILDIQAFIYCATLCAQSQIEEKKHTVYFDPDKPNVLPAAVVELLGTENQKKWLVAAYKMFLNQYGSDLGEIRLTLIRGIEVVRCVGNHGLDVKLLVALAKAFEERSKTLSKQSEIEFNDARAELYWKAALPLLEKLRRNQAISFSTNRLFEYKMKEFSQSEINENINGAKLFTAIQLMKKTENEKALQIFETLRDPYASFYQAQIYKSMADKEINQYKENVTSEMRSQHIILLTKARDCLYLTLDRLRDPSTDRKHPLNEKLGTEMDRIERLLSRIDPDTNNRNECDVLSDENVSSIESENYNSSAYHTTYANGHFSMRQENHNHSTPFKIEHSRREARPSPERLDAQLRQLAASKETAITHILEQNKVMVESHKSLVEELKHFRDAVCTLTTTVNDLKGIKHTVEDIKGIKKSVEELKTAVDELQNFRNISDVVHEMKKEIADLKKDTTKIKSNQLSDEDLYVLDEEYGADYGSMNSNVSGLTSSPMYPNLAARMPPVVPNNLAAYAANSALYHGMHAMYPYAGLGLPQTGGLPFGADGQLPDYRSMNILPPTLPPQLLPSAYQQSPLLPPPTVNQTPMNQPGLSSSLHQGPLHQGALHQGALQQGALHQSAMQQGAFGHVQMPQMSTPIFKDTAPTSVPSIFSNPQTLPHVTVPASKPAPVNVVITSSDPLPSTKVTTTQQLLFVTIPPQHLKGNQQKVHNYQIPLPTQSQMTSTPSVIKQPPLLPISTQSLLSNVAPPVYSAIDKSPKKNTSLGFQIEKTLSESFTNNSSLLGKSNTSIEEHDPCPDFKPIIPLPDEVPVNTGEENETVLFCEHAKLFRFVNNEWKERGVGNLKLLKNEETQKVRLLMRRDQVHKICANHYLTKFMLLKPMGNQEKAYVWATKDFSEGEISSEMFCVRFVSAELAKKFYDNFEKAKINLPDEDVETKNGVNASVDVKATVDVKPDVKDNKVGMGGFTFISTPTFKPKDDVIQGTVKVTAEVIKPSPFASLQFIKSPEKETPKPFGMLFGANKNEPTFTFNKPTTETDSTFTFLKSTSTPTPSSPFVTTPMTTVSSPFVTTPMTTVSSPFVTTPITTVSSPFITTPLANTSSPFGTATSSPFGTTPIKTVQEEESVHETVEEFEPTADFKPVIPLPDLVDVKTGEENAEILFESRAKLLRYDSALKEWKERGIGQMKILKESNVRLVMRREQVHKVCCNHQLLKSMVFTKMAKTPTAAVWCAKDFTEGVFNNENFCIRFKTEELLNNFLDVIKKAQDSLDDVAEKSEVSDKKSRPTEVETATTSKGFGDKFKQKLGTWNCKNCYIVNEGRMNSCIACETPRNENVKTEIDNNQFCFGVAKTLADSSTKGFGDTFKPKQGSWECKGCYTRNSADVETCVACQASKDGTVKEKKNEPQSIDLSTGGLKFNFGIPAQKIETKTETKTESAVSFSFANATTTTPKVTANQGFGDAFKPKAGSWQCKDCYTRNEGDYCLACNCPKDDTIPVKENSTKGVDLDTGGMKFNFGMPAASTPAFSFNNQASGDNKSFSFSLNNAASPKSENKDEIVFGSPHKAGFEFTPRSPRRQSGGQAPDEESENSYYEDEEDNIYFKPVIPLPDRVEVTTGEENEVILYSHRAKLFRYTNGEWKERGLGELKILLNEASQKLRVLMRREQIHKICLNHMLTSEVKYTSKDDKTWLFSAADYSESELEYQNFCLRFKNGEIATEFMKAVEEALKRAVTNDDKSDDSSEVEFVSETSVSKEEEAEALRLMLPAKFMSYRQRPDCTCEQCKKEDDMLKNIGEGEKQKDVITPKPISKADTTPTLRDLLGKPPLLNVPPMSANLSNAFSLGSGTNVFGGKPVFGQLNNTGLNNSAVPKNLFGTNTSNVFGPATTTSHVFGTASSTTGSVFGTASQPATTTSNIFGGGSVQAKTSGNIFGTPSQTTTGNIFGTPSQTTTTGNIFGTSSQSKTTGNIFGGGNQSTGNLFGTPAASPNTSIFKTATPTSSNGATSQPTTGNIFGTPVQQKTTGSIFDTTTQSKTTGNIFGGSSQPTTGNLFGTPKTTELASTTATIKPSIFNTGTVTSTTPSSPFSTTPSPVVFGESANIFNKNPAPSSRFSGNLFSNSPKTTSANNIFGGAAVLAPAKQQGGALLALSKEESAKFNDTPVLTGSPELSFSSLAAKSNTVAFAKSANDSNPFANLGAGAPVFGSTNKTPQLNKSSSKKSNETTEEENDDNYDPHYEPIIALPDMVEVRTGEEDETVLFCERGKLFRYDGVWKERGVGDFKVLHDPKRNTYRLLLRREQVFKVVLNQRITSDLDIQPHTLSSNAWTWGGYNCVENETVIEKLAVRFKNETISNQFFASVQKAIDAVKHSESNPTIPTTVENIAGAVKEREEHAALSVEDVSDYDEDYDEEDETTTIFNKPCKLSELSPNGEWIELEKDAKMDIYYDSELYGCRISITDNEGAILSNSIIGKNTIFKITNEAETECEWRAVECVSDDLHWRDMKVTFESPEYAQECYHAYLESLEFAAQATIYDDMPSTISEEHDD